MEQNIPIESISGVTDTESHTEEAEQISNGTAVTSHESATYDDVYVPQNLAVENGSASLPACRNGHNNKPPIKKKPKISLSKFRVYTAGQNDYENVKLHNLTASLKKKFMPKKHGNLNNNSNSVTATPSGDMVTAESSFTELNNGDCCRCAQTPQAPTWTISKETLFKDGKCIACGRAKDNITNDVMNQQTVLSSRGSGGIGIVENDLYHEDNKCAFY